MSLRDSLDLIRTVRPDAGTSALEHEILAERASSLGAAERKVINAVAALEMAEDDRTRLCPWPAKSSGNISCNANSSASAATPT